ncbi:hypothetical protein HY251_04420 [bacterium]|nr:hypothetical protein [bacterium]
MRRRFVGAALVFLLAGAARAEDQKSAGDAQAAINFPSSRGLAGMRDMIDARVPEKLAVRGLLRFEHDSLNVESDAIAHSVDVYAAELILGASALSIVDVGFRLPVEFRVDKHDIRGFSSRRVSANGVGDAELSGKAGFKLGPITLGPYATIHVNSGSALLEKHNELQLGGAAALSLLDDRLAVHLNVSEVAFSSGKWAIGYRLGASVVPWADDLIVLRVYGYFDGLEYAGTKIQGNDVRAAVGVQAIVFKFVIVDFGSYIRLYDGDLPRHVRDVATYGINFGGGVSINF